MKPSLRETTLTQLNWRYATKQFDAHHQDQRRNLGRALEGQPGLDALVIRLAAVEVSEHYQSGRARTVGFRLLGQRQVADASASVVFAVKRNFTEADIDTYLNRIVAVRTFPRFAEWLSRHDGRKSNHEPQRCGPEELATNQTYIALGNFLTSAALLGIDARRPLEGIGTGEIRRDPRVWKNKV